MWLLLVLAVAVIPAVAQSPAVQLNNATHPASKDFQVGDSFEIVITGAPNQPVSVRTTMQGRTDWSPVIGWTDASGRWPTAGHFDRADFGNWSEDWTVGGKLATPLVHFSVGAPCLKVGQHSAMMIGAAMIVTCETAEGPQAFSTPSDSEPFRTPDGRTVPGRVRSSMTADQYHMEIIQSIITGDANRLASRTFGDETGALIMKIIGVNALSEGELQNVLSVIRAAFENPKRIPQGARNPSETLRLLRGLADSSDQESLKHEIAESMEYVKAR
jgi:hypothetical protein